MSPLLLALLAATPGLANYVCPVTPGPVDQSAIAFGYAIQELLNSYYSSTPVNSTFYSSLPSPTVPMTDFLTNTEGLGVQAQIGSDALMAAGMAAGISMPPTCDFSYPPVTNATMHLMNAYVIEATLCGAFIGLADYVQSPQASFLMARLAAEHGIHASYIGSHMKPVVFPTNSTSLTPAFTPSQIASSPSAAEAMMNMGVGYLGQYLNGCVPPPAAPCSGSVQITMTGSMLNNQGMGNSTGAGMATGTGTMGMGPTNSPMAFTGAAVRNGGGMDKSLVAGLVAIGIILTV